MQKLKVYGGTAINYRKQGMCLFLLAFFMGLCFSVNVKATDSSTITKAQLINNSVTVDGKGNAIYYDYYYWEEYNSGMEYKGVVYYNERNDYYPNNPDIVKTTIRLAEPITDLNEPFYQKERTLDCGVKLLLNR